MARLRGRRPALRHRRTASRGSGRRSTWCPARNIVREGNRDSSTVWLDLETRDPRAALQDVDLVRPCHPPVGIAGRRALERASARPAGAGDRSTFFRNPFRDVWVFSVRDNQYDVVNQRTLPPLLGSRRLSRRRADWGGHDPVAWVKSDSQDFARPGAGATTRTVQPRLRGVRERDARAVLGVARRIAVTRKDQRDRRRVQPRRLPLAPAGSPGVHRCLGRRGQLELGQRPVGRRLLPGGRRSAVLLRERTSGPAGHRRAGRLQHGPGDASPRRIRVDGLDSGGGARAPANARAPQPR